MPGSTHPRGVDVLLRDALIVDGTGAQPFEGDVGIRGESIEYVGRRGATPPNGATAVDCGGLVLAPGFIDVHTHSDVSYLLDPLADSKLRQGVTTEVVGNCGFSPYPVTPGSRSLLEEFVRGLGTPQVDLEWTDVAGYADVVRAAAPVINVAPLVGHGALRIATAGVADVPVDGLLLEPMANLLVAGLEQGAFGLSSGLTYVPSSFAPPEEIHALAAAVSRFDAVYATHARVTDTMFGTFDEAIEVGRVTGARVQYSHVALNDPRQWGRADEVAARFSAAHDAGVDVGYDVYPYAASASSLTQYLPGWLQERGEDGLREMVGVGSTFRRARDELARGLFGRIPWDWERVVVSLAGPGDEDLEGLTIADAAAKRGREPEELCLDLCARHGNAAQVVLFYRDEADVATFLTHPLAVVGSDGRAMAATEPGRPHPRSFGTYPRLLGRYVRDHGALGLAEAVHKSTLAPAQRLGLRQVGQIASGTRADLVVFDPGSIADTASWTEPKQHPHGVRHVWVSGRQVLADGRLTGERPGRVLRRGVD
jgi:N-acyl-D-aspartate/D-glutamate deacylase